MSIVILKGKMLTIIASQAAAPGLWGKGLRQQESGELACSSAFTFGHALQRFADQRIVRAMNSCAEVTAVCSSLSSCTNFSLIAATSSATARAWALICDVLRVTALGPR